MAIKRLFLLLWEIFISIPIPMQIFKEKNGTSFSDTLLSIRMEKAKEMLEDIRYKSYDIAYYIGYDNPKNFSRAFKSYYGMTPMEYRKSKTEEGQ